MNLPEEDKNKILDYKLDVYQCVGSNTEKLDWFKVINIAGEKLFQQELRNAVYSGDWLTRAKEGKSIEEYMAAHQFDEVNKEGTPEGFPLFKYVKDVFSWVEKTFLENSRVCSLKMESHHGFGLIFSTIKLLSQECGYKTLNNSRGFNGTA